MKKSKENTRMEELIAELRKLTKELAVSRQKISRLEEELKLVKAENTVGPAGSPKMIRTKKEVLMKLIGSQVKMNVTEQTAIGVMIAMMSPLLNHHQRAETVPQQVRPSTFQTG